MPVHISVYGSFRNAQDFLNRMKEREQYANLEKYGPIGVEALKENTPVDKGETADSWDYEVVDKPGYYAIHWYNSHVEDGVNIAAILQYGHGTGTGGYVTGIDYVNPAMASIFDDIVNEMWEEVTR